MYMCYAIKKSLFNRVKVVIMGQPGVEDDVK